MKEKKYLAYMFRNQNLASNCGKFDDEYTEKI